MGCQSTATKILRITIIIIIIVVVVVFVCLGVPGRSVCQKQRSAKIAAARHSSHQTALGFCSFSNCAWGSLDWFVWVWAHYLLAVVSYLETNNNQYMYYYAFWTMVQCYQCKFIINQSRLRWFPLDPAKKKRLGQTRGFRDSGVHPDVMKEASDFF